jgi:hypothetical protein
MLKVDGVFMSDKDTKGTREFLDKAIHEFHTTKDSDRRLRSLWKISQLVEDTTDEELFELASSIAVEEDPRLRGEICYTISRSQRPQLIKFLSDMIRDENSYVRRSAIIALSELGGNEAMIVAMDPILDELNGLRDSLANLKRNVDFLCERIQQNALDNNLVPSDDIEMDNYMICWETYLRNEQELLKNHMGKYVAIYGDEIVGIGEDQIELADMIYDKYGDVEALICRIEEEREPIRMPPARQIME